MVIVDAGNGAEGCNAWEPIRNQFKKDLGQLIFFFFTTFSIMFGGMLHDELDGHIFLRRYNYNISLCLT